MSQGFTKEMEKKWYASGPAQYVCACLCDFMCIYITHTHIYIYILYDITVYIYIIVSYLSMQPVFMFVTYTGFHINAWLVNMLGPPRPKLEDSCPLKQNRLAGCAKQQQKSVPGENHEDVVIQLSGKSTYNNSSSF